MCVTGSTWFNCASKTSTCIAVLKIWLYIKKKNLLLTIFHLSFSLLEIRLHLFALLFSCKKTGENIVVYAEKSSASWDMDLDHLTLDIPRA